MTLIIITVEHLKIALVKLQLILTEDIISNSLWPNSEMRFDVCKYQTASRNVFHNTYVTHSAR